METIKTIDLWTEQQPNQLECFKIEHHCAFINKTNTRIIPLQDNSLLDKEKIKEKYMFNSGVKK